MTAEWASVLVGLLEVGAIVGLGLLGRHTFKKWREEKIFSRQAELAEHALALTYQAIEVFNDVRNPWGHAGEGESRAGREAELEEVRRIKDNLFTPIERLNSHSEYFKKVIDLRPSFMAVFGKDKCNPLDEILKVRFEISHLAGLLLSRAEDDLHLRGQPRDEHSINLRKEFEELRWKGLAKEDAVDKRLNGAQVDMEKYVSPLLRSRFRVD
ncbi:MAG: hypothetical protein WEC00_02115 [Dongiaceae bacterium]